MSGDKRCRCSWCTDDGEYRAYHDREWGRPQHDDRRLFELLILEGMQAGLSWLTVLKKREAFRRAFAEFEPARVAGFDGDDEERLMGDAGIVRNRRKILAAIGNARAFVAVQREFGSFDRFIWRYTGYRALVCAPGRGAAPAHTPLAEEISAELYRRGFRFVGPTITYSFMQAAGLVNDHERGCWLAGRELECLTGMK